MRKRSNHTWLPLAGSLILVVGALWLSLRTLNTASAAATTPTQKADAVQVYPEIIQVSQPQPAPAAKSPEATNWCLAGNFQGWSNTSTPLYDDGSNGDLIGGDGVFSLDYTMPITPGRYEFKAVECNNWANAFPSDNAWLITAAADQVIKFTLDTNNHSADAGVIMQPTQNIVNVEGDNPPVSYTVVGPWQNWNNTAVTTTMTAVGNGLYRLAYEFAAAGSYEAKISQTNDWSNQFGADGRNKGAPTIPFSTSAANQTVIFLLDVVTGRMTITPNSTGTGTWCLAGAFNGWSESGFPLFDDGTNGDLIGGDGVFSLDYTMPITPGRYEFKTNACNWATAYPSDNAWVLTSSPAQVVKFTFDTNDHSTDAGTPLYPMQHIVNAWDDMPSSFTVVGPWQGWNNGSVTTTMTALGNNSHILTYAFAAGDYEAKISQTSNWDNQFGSDGRNKNAPTILFSVAADNDVVAFWLDGRNGRFAVVAPEPVLPPIDLSLVKAPISHTVEDEIFYFLLPDRYQNGDSLNDTGYISGTALNHGFLPDNKNFYHGGDLAGLALTGTLDYLQNLGVSALWITPIFKNDVLEGSGTDVNTTYAAYHGYWIIDYENVDPHLGTDQEFIDFVTAAHTRGIKVYLDIVANHTGNLIDYLEGQSSYRNKTDYPYLNASGVAFDDRDYVGTGTFPPLDAAISFPYTPITTGVKNPTWLNNPIYYHNRGDSSFAGESSTYGDFFGLDDLFTEHPDVVNGFIDIFTNTISTYDIDGFRLDTAKHVNIEFWEQVSPAVMNYATNNGKPDFFMFAEVFEYSTPILSTFTTQGKLPSVLDFQTQGYAYGFAIKSEATDNLQTHFANDDYYTDADSNAYQLANFISNHDIGRFGGFIRNEGITDDAEMLARTELGHALMFFARGFPVVYYGDEQGFVSDGGDADAREDMMPSQVASYNDNDLIGTSATTADDNLDPNHPIYQTLADYATVYKNNMALRRGAQIHRYSQSSAGLYIFSRMDRDEQVEYVVALNNAETAASATFPVYAANMGFTAVYPLTSTAVITSDGSNQLTITVPALGVSIYRANAPLTLQHAPAAAPFPTFTSPAADEAITGRTEVGVSLTETNRYLEVNFAVKIGDGSYQYLGTDNNAPYRIFYDVSGIPVGTPVTFQAIVNDLHGNYSNNVVTAVVGEETSTTDQYAIIHYYRTDGDYGDYTSSDFSDFWGLHLWGNAIHPDEGTDWTSPKKFSGFDSYGAYVAIRLQDPSQPVNFIIHRGNDKDTPNDRSFDPSVTPEIWLVQGDANNHGSRAEAVGETLVHYNRLDGIYTDWGLHLWQDGSPSLTIWPTREMPSSYDDFGAVYSITTNVYPTLEVTRGLNFIVHNGIGSQEPDRTYTPTVNYEVWVNSAETNWYAQEGAAADFATIHYRRCLSDYGDFTSSDYNDFWGLHLWTGALTGTQWTAPLKPISQDGFGLVYRIPLQADATSLSYILHRGDTKDVDPDQSLELGSAGYEIWVVEGDGGNNTLSAGMQFTSPAIAFSVADRVCAGVTIGNINQQRAYWLSENIIGWDPINPATAVYLHSAPTGGLLLDSNGISGGTVYTLTQNGVITGAIANKFPHLRGLPAWEIDGADLATIPDMLKGQIAVSAFDESSSLVDATGLQIPGVLDDLYTYDGDLGITWENDITPTLRLWAPTAKNVTLHLFTDAISTTTSITYPMTLDPDYGVWRVTGLPDWAYQYYLYEVEVYVHSTGQVEHNLVTDPYAISLSMNSTRSQIVDLADPALMPPGWLELQKPPLPAPEDITIYELHVRDFSINDSSVAPEDQGTYKAFTYADSYGMQHLQALADAGLSHIHLLPVFDIATINEDKSQWAEAAIDPNAGPASQQQQAAVSAVADQDGFNWGYDPFHYNTPEGSYSTDPNGPTRIIEFREMIQALNERGLRVVMDVVYNHTSASGQNPNSVLDQVVPGYYHRLDAQGKVEHSTCCENTASEHNMMGKLMVDSLTMWATAYKVDAFRFDLMGHHMITNMVDIRTALDDLTIVNSGVNGSEIYLYGEGWNFGEVANNARGINATQLNLAGTGIGTFSDRLRDAVRGGGPFDSGEALKTQGFANGLYYDSNSYTPPFDPLAQLLHYSDWVRAGLAGNLADYAFITANDVYTTAAHIDYNGQPAGYTADPQEQIVYISKHDNQTLFDINVYAMPTATTTMSDRVRVQNVGLSIASLSQGVPFFQAGSDLLRSKSLDRDSYNSGDWFNKLDFTYQSNNFGVGLPIASKNQENWSIMTPYLEDTTIQAGYDDISFMAALFQEWMEVRYSSEMFHLGTLADVEARLAFYNTGSSQVPGLIVMSLSDMVEGMPDIDPNHELIVVLFNANDEAQSFTVAGLTGLDLTLHPVLANSVDMVVRTSTFDNASGTFNVPGRTTAVFVLAQPDVAPNSVSLDGPTSGLLDTAYTFTATVSPISTTLPLTLTWSATGQADETVVLTDTLVDTAVFTWDTPGTKTITVTAVNAAGTVSAVHMITVTEETPVVAPTAVNLSGPSDGDIDTAYTFTATVMPISTTLPLTLTWSATGQTDVVVMLTDTLVDTAVFTWDTPGTKTITVTAVNTAGTAVVTQTVTITVPEYTLYLPIVFNQ